jgi:RimJ/RimL family protein N-acetyltransferase
MLREATEADIAFIRSLTTRSDYAPFIGDSDEAELRQWIGATDAKVLIWEGGSARGFAVFRGIGKPGGVVELFRIALDRAGGGNGAAFFGALVDHAFATLGAARVWLDASAENPRAIRLYTSLGFREEGRLRSHWHRPALGRPVDLVLMGMLRSEWEALEPGQARA